MERKIGPPLKYLIEHTVYGLTKDGHKSEIQLLVPIYVLGIDFGYVSYEETKLEPQVDIIEAKSERFQNYVSALKRRIQREKDYKFQEKLKKHLGLIENLSGIIVVTKYVEPFPRTY